MSAAARTPGEEIPAEVARRIRLVVLDVDGVLTDGGVYMGTLPGGEALELKRFDIQDGLGVKMLMWSGIEVAIVSGRVSQATTLRAAELGVTECHQDPEAEKLPLVGGVLEERGLGWDEVAMMADDLADLPVLRKVGLPVAVANAVPEVVSAARWQTTRVGGSGAVRELAEALLAARGEWDRRVEAYLAERSGEETAAPETEEVGS